MIQPTTRNNGEAIKPSNARLREQSRQQNSGDSSDSVRGKDVEAVVEAEAVFELGREVAYGACHEAEEDCCWGADIS